MGDVGFLVAQRHWSDEPLHLYWFSRETLSDKRSLRHHTLPCLALALSSLENLEHLVFRNASNFGKRYSVFGRLVFPLLLDGAGQSFGVLLALAIQQICGQGTLGRCASIGLLDVALVVGLERLFHLDLLRMALSVKQLGLDTEGLLCYCRRLVDQTSLALTSEENEQSLRKRLTGELTCAQNDRSDDHVA